MISQMVTSQTAFRKSYGFFISAMKLGSVICPMKVYAMLRNAFMPATNVVPAAGTAKTIGSPPGTKVPAAFVCEGTGVYPAVPCLPSAPANAAARMTETNVKKAEAVASFDKALKVRGIEQSQDTAAPIAEKPTVQTLWLLIVLR